LKKTNGRSFFDFGKKRTTVRTETEKKRNERKPVFRFFRSFFHTPEFSMILLLEEADTGVEHTYKHSINHPRLVQGRWILDSSCWCIQQHPPINYTALPINYTALPINYTALPINYTALLIIYTARISLLAGGACLEGRRPDFREQDFREQLAGSFSSVLSSNNWTISSSNASALSRASLISRRSPPCTSRNSLLGPL
jgi:hypothetical protein